MNSLLFIRYMKSFGYDIFFYYFQLKLMSSYYLIAEKKKIVCSAPWRNGEFIIAFPESMTTL